MGRHEEVSEQTAVRRSLFANGYLPLANKDKMCVLPGWPHQPVEEAQITIWSTQLKWRATGVRIECGLVTTRLDINDAAAIESIVDALPEGLWERLQHAPLRRCEGDKEAWFVRLAEGEETFYRLASSGWRRGEDDETVQRVEVFACDNGGRQFGAYGAHTICDDGEVAVAYSRVAVADTSPSACRVAQELRASSDVGQRCAVRDILGGI